VGQIATLLSIDTAGENNGLIKEAFWKKENILFLRQKFQKPHLV